MPSQNVSRVSIELCKIYIGANRCRFSVNNIIGSNSITVTVRSHPFFKLYELSTFCVGHYIPVWCTELIRSLSWDLFVKHNFATAENKNLALGQPGRGNSRVIEVTLLPSADHLCNSKLVRSFHSIRKIDKNDDQQDDRKLSPG